MVAPDESRNLAYISTCSDERPLESTHFLVLNLENGEYRDLGETNHMYAFIVPGPKLADAAGPLANTPPATKPVCGGPSRNGS